LFVHHEGKQLAYKISQGFVPQIILILDHLNTIVMLKELIDKRGYDLSKLGK